MPTRVRAERWVVPALLTAVGVVLSWHRWIDPRTWSFVDLQDFVQGGRSVLQGTDVYAFYAGILPFNYPPFGALVFVPLAAVGFDSAKWLMTALSVVSFVLMVGLSVGRSQLPLTRGQALMWSGVLVAFGAALEPVQRTLIYGQVNLILAALVLADLFLVPPRARGLVLGLVAGVKLTPAAFGLYFLLKRDWGAAARSVLSGIFTVSVAWLLVPQASHDYWLGGLDKLSRFGTDALQLGNQSLRACWARLLGGQPGFLYPLSVLVVLVLTVYAAGKLLRIGDDLAAVAVIAVGALLVSPISWTHHWVWVVCALVVMAQRRWRIAVALVALVMFLPPMWVVAGQDPLTLSLPGQLVASTYILLGVAFLVAMSVSKPKSQGVAQEPMKSTERGNSDQVIIPVPSAGAVARRGATAHKTTAPPGQLLARVAVFTSGLARRPPRNDPAVERTPVHLRRVINVYGRPSRTQTRSATGQPHGPQRRP